ncbi:MAG: SDR family NAD(P)-dependent oxidoreductase [Coriobacteriales bacterium]|jgi:short-subunit dehydrogenase
MMNVALITGASGGIGKEFALIYAQEGFDLVLVARNEEKLAELKNQIEARYHVRVWTYPKDLSEKDAALDVFDFVIENKIEVGVLINNAGFGYRAPFGDSDWQRQFEMVQVNVVALMQLTWCFIKPMVEQGWGRIINVSSVASFCAGPNMSIYYASKAFVRSFSEAVHEELKGTGVAVTAVCPPPTSTGFEKNADLTGSRMFNLIRPISAHDVAVAGFRSSMLGRPLCYVGAFTKIASVGVRFVPRSVSRRFAEFINGQATR